MAAMAPALTDAPAEAHHIRFKLAAPSSSLSPSSTTATAATDLLLHTKNPEDRREDPPPPLSEGVPPPPVPLGKLQPLVASYRCSDVTALPSGKESIQLPGGGLKASPLKGRRVLPATLLNGADFLLRKRTQIVAELPVGNLKGLMSAGTNGGEQHAAPLNGLAIEGRGVSDSGCVVNGAKPAANPRPQTPPPSDPQPQTPPHLNPCPQTPPPSDPTVAAAALSGRVPLRQNLRLKRSPDVSPNADRINPQRPQSAALSPFAHDGPTPGPSPGPGSAPTEQQVESAEALPPGGQRSGSDRQDSPSPPPPCCSSDLESQVRERLAANGGRQADIESRLWRLRKRLQVVQAKQVERHLQQQLGGFLDLALSRILSGSRRAEATPTAASWRAGRHSSSGGGRDGLSRFLRGGAMPLELERLYLSGTANLRAAENAFDSDVTESSSGGDSDLEEAELLRADAQQRHVKIVRGAESRYTCERAAIISHWNWLQAHISDLEYRIRQQSDIYRQIRAGKGSVELGGVSVEVKAEPVSVQEGGLERLEHTAVNMAAAEPAGARRTQNGAPLNGVLARMADGDSKPPYDSSCVAARTRPLLGCRRRRLILPGATPNLNGKVQRATLSPLSPVLLAPCRCNPGCCVMCVGGSAPSREEPQYQLPQLERLSRLDQSLHPILSFTEDVCVGVRLQQVFLAPPRSAERSKVKKLNLKHKLSSSREKHKFTSSLLRMGLCKSRPERPRPSEGGGVLSGAARLEAQSALLSPTPGVYDRNYGRKRAREPSLERCDAQAASPKLFLDSSSSCPTLVNLPPSLHSLTRQLSTSSESSAPLGLAGVGGANMPPIKRRRGESSFDINNIVIPMSVAATTRVEKLQYKEILTPRWRCVDIFSQPITEEEDEREVEDLSEAAFLQLHQMYEDQERSRWSWMALTPAGRRGSRSYKSVDGRSTPLLCGTPQPASPADLLLDFGGGAASPLSPPSPDTPSNPLTPCSRDSAHRLLSSEDTRCSTPEYTFEEQMVSPWERRSFPLSEDPDWLPDELSVDVLQRVRSVSGCRATPPGGGRRPELDDTDTLGEEGGAKLKGPAQTSTSSSSSSSSSTTTHR